jgi:hypothetical protein
VALYLPHRCPFILLVKRCLEVLVKNETHLYITEHRAPLARPLVASLMLPFEDGKNQAHSWLRVDSDHPLWSDNMHFVIENHGFVAEPFFGRNVDPAQLLELSLPSHIDLGCYEICHA